jgi:hypothetical protein
MKRSVQTTIKKDKVPKLNEARYMALSVAKYLFSLDPKREYFSDKRKISTGSGFSSVLLGN